MSCTSMVRNLQLLTLGKLIRARKQHEFGRRLVHKVSYADEEVILEERDDEDNSKTRSTNIEECVWIPHPRNGIYFPKGHDWVMEDVPPSAASLAPTFWLRSVDGVDPVHLHPYHYHLH